MRKIIMSALLCLSFTKVSAQDFSSSLFPEMAIYSLFTEQALKFLRESPNLIEGNLKQVQQVETFETNQECLGGLQILTMAAAVVTNVMPFSTVYIKEGARGPEARYRLLLNGEKVHFEVYCDNTVLTFLEIDWNDKAIRDYRLHRQETFDAAIGAFILAYLQGLFEDDQVVSSTATKNAAKEDKLELLSNSKPAEPSSSSVVTALDQDDIAALDFSPCWVVDPGSLASRVSVTVEMEMIRNGKIKPGSIKLISYEGGTEDHAEVAFQSVRRALFRCQKSGYNLPQDKYDLWKIIKVTADPKNIRQ